MTLTKPLLGGDSAKGAAAPKAPAFRVVTADILRGFTMMMAIFTGSRGDAYDKWQLFEEKANPQWAWLIPSLGHATWVGCTGEDIVIPFFHAAMGTGMVFMLKLGSFKVVEDAVYNENWGIGTRQNGPRTDSLDLFKIIFRRSVRLWILGLFLQGRLFAYSIFSGPSLFVTQFQPEFMAFLWNQVRLPGVLQRYGMVYMLVGCLVIFGRGLREVDIPKSWVMRSGPMGFGARVKQAVCIFYQLVYVIWPAWFITFILATGCTYIKHNWNGAHDGQPADQCTPGDWLTSPRQNKCNIDGLFDAAVYTCHHLYDAANCFDPEGILTLGTIAINLIGGVHCGLTVWYAKTAQFKDMNERHTVILSQWLFVGCMLIVATCIAWQFEPLNKPMWTCTFAFFSTGMAYFCVIGIYCLKDVYVLQNEGKGLKPELPDIEQGGAVGSPSSRLIQYDRTAVGVSLGGTGQSPKVVSREPAKSTTENLASVAQPAPAAPAKKQEGVSPRSYQPCNTGSWWADFLDAYFVWPCLCVGRNALLSWVSFNKTPDTYFCEWWGVQSFGGPELKIKSLGWTICDQGAFAYDPVGLSMTMAFLHCVAIFLICQWLHKIGKYFVI